MLENSIFFKCIGKVICGKKSQLEFTIRDPGMNTVYEFTETWLKHYNTDLQNEK